MSNTIKCETIPQNANADKDYTVRLYESNGLFFISVNSSRVAMFDTLEEADARYCNLVNHVSPKKVAFDHESNRLADQILARQENDTLYGTW